MNINELCRSYESFKKVNEAIDSLLPDALRSTGLYKKITWLMQLYTLSEIKHYIMNTINPKHPVFGAGYRKLEDHDIIEPGDETACVSTLLTIIGEQWVEVPSLIGKTVAEALVDDADANERVFRRSEAADKARLDWLESHFFVLHKDENGIRLYVDPPCLAVKGKTLREVIDKSYKGQTGNNPCIEDLL